MRPAPAGFGVETFFPTLNALPAQKMQFVVFAD
jgi:hypothetical protein